MQSNPPPKAVQAREGFYFLANDSNGVIDQITGHKQLTQKEVFNWKMILETRHCWFAKHNISYFYLAVPNKHCLYSEFLPEHIHLSQSRPITQILNEVEDSFVSFTYPLDELISHKEEGLLYRLKDSHWTHLGAYHCYSALAQKMLDAGVPLRKIRDEEISFSEQPTEHSDLGVHFDDSKDTDVVMTMPLLNISCAFNNGVLNTGNLQVWKNNSGEGLPRALIFRDSFCNTLIAFLAASFSEVAFAWQPNVDFQLVKEFDPDVVISQQVERFITTAPQDLGAPIQVERQQQKVDAKQIIQAAPVFNQIIENDDPLLSKKTSDFIQKRLTEFLSALVVRFPDSLAVQANYILDLLRLNETIKAENHYISLINRKKDIPIKFHQLVRSRINSKRRAPEVSRT